MILDHQRPDGGWSIRSFAEPEKWGRRCVAQREPETIGPLVDEVTQYGQAETVTPVHRTRASFARL